MTKPGIVEPIRPGRPDDSAGVQPRRPATIRVRRLRPVSAKCATSASQVRSAFAAMSIECSST
jgi:hypothetical protein